MSQIILTEAVAPPTPPTGKVTWYAKVDKRLYFKDDTGLETEVRPTGAGTGDLLADGTIPLTANWDVGAFEITALRFHSDEATLSPFTVVSTAVVTNLNADQLDGQEGTYYETPALISQGDAEAGVATGIESFSALRVAQAIAAQAAGDVATDVIWDAKGDLAGGTGADTAVKLTVGANDTVLTADSAEATGMKWATPAVVNTVATDVIWDAKGDLAGGTGADTAVKLTVGANDTVLTADSAEATGMKWAPPAASGLTVEFKTASFTAEAGKKYKVDSTGGAVVATLPAGTNLDNIVIQDIGHDAAANNITVNPNGAETIDNDTTFVIDQDDGDIDIGYNNGDTNWEVSADGSPDPNDYVSGFSGINAQTGTTYEFVAQDLTDCVTADNASASTYSIPDSLGNLGHTLNLYNTGAGVVTIDMAGTDTLDTADNDCAQYKAVTVLKIAATVWAVVGGS